MGTIEIKNMGCGGSKDGKKEELAEGGKPEAKPEESKPVAKSEEGKPAAKPEEGKPAAKQEAAKAAEREAWMSEDLENMMNDYFTRYDLDGSGTINSNDELKQLCTNLVVKLELDMDVQTIDK